MSGHESALANKYLELCQVLVQKGQAFSFTLKTKPFSISLDTKEREATLEPRMVKKKLSPSALKRNQKRKEIFLKKKSDSERTEEQQLEETPKVVKSLSKCDQCERTFNTESGLKIHVGKAHKDPPPIEQLRDTTEVSSLKGTPEKEAPREEQCVCCGEVMSPLHQCIEEQNTPNFACLKCDKEFKTEKDQMSHRVQEEHFWWTCDTCGKDFEDWDEFLEHESDNDCV